MARATLAIRTFFQNRFRALQTGIFFHYSFKTFAKTHSSVRGAENGDSTDMLNLLAFCIW